MTRLNELRDNPGANKVRVRVGRGIGSGLGKTGGRGGKGQTARSGSSIRIGFEGGQMPLIRRIPKRGFNNTSHATVYIPVNVGDLEIFDNGATVDETAIRAVGLANGPGAGIKVLGNGELTKKLNLSVSAISASAKTKIEAKGGKVELVVRKAAAAKA